MMIGWMMGVMMMMTASTLVDDAHGNGCQHAVSHIS